MMQKLSTLKASTMMHYREQFCLHFLRNNKTLCNCIWNFQRICSVNFKTLKKEWKRSMSIKTVILRICTPTTSTYPRFPYQLNKRKKYTSTRGLWWARAGTNQH